MSVLSVILVLAAVIAAFFLVGALTMYRSMFMSTRGKRIADYPNPRKALVILDIQEGYAGTAARQPVTEPPPNGMLSTVNRLIDRAAGTGMEVAYIRQVFGNNLFVRLHGGRRWGRVIIDRRIKIINGNDFAKNRTDAFSNRNFEQLLIDRQVNELFLVGVDAAYCVYYTALGALQRGYRVTVVRDAVMSRKAMTDVLERYRRRGICVITSDELLRGGS
ncbi:cysteine hydrolase family protein [Geobacter argillaceus]|uniref:Nicotinamidase-related amidase n=1 Tax=Geobacter argillaceus TaxID=345631 RepID=A0A562V665_9BACT|nr:cysteine hydrolase [Geobacter argillaceus]TWJ13404.1 nicotinamidase-related amidase [Geobacter argillaceus]